MLIGSTFKTFSGIKISETEIRPLFDGGYHFPIALNEENDIVWRIGDYFKDTESPNVQEALDAHVCGKLQIDPHEVEKILLAAIAKDGEKVLVQELSECHRALEIVNEMTIAALKDADRYEHWVRSKITEIIETENCYFVTSNNFNVSEFLPIKNEFQAIEGNIQLYDRIFKKFEEFADKVQEIGGRLDESHRECFHNNYHLCRLIRIGDGKYLPEDINFTKENALKFLTVKASDVKELFELLA